MGVVFVSGDFWGNWRILVILSHICMSCDGCKGVWRNSGMMFMGMGWQVCFMGIVCQRT